MSQRAIEPANSPFLRKEFVWVRQDERRREMSMLCQLPKCRKKVYRKTGGRVALFCSAEHSRLYDKRRDEVEALVAELTEALSEHLPADGRPTTRAGRRILADFYYAYYLRTAFPDLDLPPLPRPGGRVLVEDAD